MSSIGKSFRTSKDSEMIGFGKYFCKIKVEAQKNLFLSDVEITISREKEGKSIKMDGVNIHKHRTCWKTYI